MRGYIKNELDLVGHTIEAAAYIDSGILLTLSGNAWTFLSMEQGYEYQLPSVSLASEERALEDVSWYTLIDYGIATEEELHAREQAKTERWERERQERERLQYEELKRKFKD